MKCGCCRCGRVANCRCARSFYVRVLTQLPQKVHPEVKEESDNFATKKILNAILRSKVTKDSIVKQGDLVQVFCKLQNAKRSKGLTPRNVTSVDKDTGAITVPGARGKPISAAIEDVRIAVSDDELCQTVLESVDEFQEPIGMELDKFEEGIEKEADAENRDDANYVISDEPPLLPQLGDHLDVYWPLDNKFYPGKVISVLNNEYTIQYDDGDQEKLNLTEE